MLDLTLLENIYTFLLNLEKDNFKINSLKLKVVRKDRSGIYFINYTDLNSFYNSNKNILDLKLPNRYCAIGDFSFLENIYVSNNNSSYKLDIKLFNITSENPISSDNTTFKVDRNTFYENDKKKYISYIKKECLDTNTKNIELANIRLGSYVDVCYVQPNYVLSEILFFENSIIKEVKK